MNTKQFSLLLLTLPIFFINGKTSENLETNQVKRGIDFAAVKGNSHNLFPEDDDEENNDDEMNEEEEEDSLFNLPKILGKLTKFRGSITINTSLNSIMQILTTTQTEIKALQKELLDLATLAKAASSSLSDFSNNVNDISTRFSLLIGLDQKRMVHSLHAIHQAESLCTKTLRTIELGIEKVTQKRAPAAVNMADCREALTDIILALRAIQNELIALQKITSSATEVVNQTAKALTTIVVRITRLVATTKPDTPTETPTNTNPTKPAVVIPGTVVPATPENATPSPTAPASTPAAPANASPAVTPAVSPAA